MEFIREIEGRKGKDGKKEKWGVFRCPICNMEVERLYGSGIYVKTCSKKCSGIKRKQESQPVKEKKSRKKPRYIDRNNLEVPEECVGCGYWGPDGCSFVFRRGYSRTGFLKGRTCREAGIYTTKKPKQMYKEYF